MRIRRRWRRRIRAGVAIAFVALVVAAIAAILPDPTTTRAPGDLDPTTTSASATTASTERIVTGPGTPDISSPVVTIAIGAESPDGHSTEVVFAATALDDRDGTTRATCVPASGSLFVVGTTPITCTADDTAGNTGIARAQVVVVDASLDQDPTIVGQRDSSTPTSPIEAGAATGPATSKSSDQSRRTIAAIGFAILALAFAGAGLRRRTSRKVAPVELAPTMPEHPVKPGPTVPAVVNRAERSRETVNASIDFRWLLDDSFALSTDTVEVIESDRAPRRELEPVGAGGYPIPDRV